MVIWNLIRRCNLTCRHCYSTSANIDFPGELKTSEILETMEDLNDFGVPAIILSGGEPLLHPDIFTISGFAKALDFYVGLSSNGTLINEFNIQTIAAQEYDYVGISLDGLRSTHDRFRRCSGSFDNALHAIRLCKEHGIKVGIRFTLTRNNADELPQLLDLMVKEDVDKFYLSHLNYAGRGNRNSDDDTLHTITRQCMDYLFDRAWHDVESGSQREYVTGNNDADGVYLLWWIARHFPHRLAHMHNRLQQWGGNASGLNIANIDNLGNVHPDTFWWHYTIGNIREQSFSTIWSDTADPLLAALRQRPRPLKDRCSSCLYSTICNGNTRVRAYQASGDVWAGDPGCYLTDNEISTPLQPASDFANVVQ